MCETFLDDFTIFFGQNWIIFWKEKLNFLNSFHIIWDKKPNNLYKLHSYIASRTEHIYTLSIFTSIWKWLPLPIFNIHTHKIIAFCCLNAVRYRWEVVSCNLYKRANEHAKMYGNLMYSYNLYIDLRKARVVTSCVELFQLYCLLKKSDASVYSHFDSVSHIRIHFWFVSFSCYLSHHE